MSGEYYSGKTVAVTGAGGYLGSALTAALQKTDARIVRVSRRDLARLPGTETLKADVRLERCWQEIVARADVIFHLAGNTSVKAAASDPSESLGSTVLPITYLESAAQAATRVPKVVFASTATVYGLTDQLPVSESAEAKPNNNYDLHKLLAEKELVVASTQGILDGVALRLANVYGPSSSTSSAEDRGILNKVMRAALKGGPIYFYGDGGSLRDYIFIDDVVRAFIVAGEGSGLSARSFNVGTGIGVSIREAFQMVARNAERITGKPVPVKSADWPDGTDPIERRNFVADISGFRTASGWQPTIGLSEGIARTLSSFANENR